MSNKPRGQPDPPAPTKLRTLFLRPLREVESVAPPLANEVVIAGGVDCVVVDFFYVPTERFVELLDGGEGVERSATAPTHGVARMQPTARVTLPFTAAAELVTQLFEIAAEGAVDLRSLGPGFIERITAAMAAVQPTAVVPGAGGGAESGGSE